jgi:8-oxo-dGTP pyrophosphatase MutT (NUDIX family)/SAM-dependent methyltransferase
MTTTLLKVAVYITRGDRLLVFKHVHQPEAGIQVPGGTLEPGEAPVEGALREAREETGLTALQAVAYLGTTDYAFDPPDPKIARRHYVHLLCLEDTPDTWVAWEHDPSDGSPGPIAFQHCWVPLAAVPRLCPSMGDLLPLIGGRELPAEEGPTAHPVGGAARRGARMLARRITPAAAAPPTRGEPMPDNTTHTLLQLVERPQPPVPWTEGEKIPWNDPDFSRRMLTFHVDQDHALASRPFATIDRHVAWIHDAVLGGRPSRVLDLGCGPGLYTERLARLGHRCTGVDFGPASIAYAREQAAAAGLDITYLEADIRTLASLPLEPVDLVMLIYGEFNVFKPEEARGILTAARRLLPRGGHVLLEPHTFELVRQLGEGPATWYSSRTGLFSERPHLMLKENHWNADAAVAIERYYVVDASTGAVTRHASTMQAYTPEGYSALLQSAGYGAPRRFASLGGDEGPVQEGLIALLAEASGPAPAH